MTTTAVSLAHYRYTVTWSPEDHAFVATVAEFPGLSSVEDTQIAALEGLSTLLADVIEDLRSTGEDVPLPLADRAYSGNVHLRMSPREHRRLALAAAEEGKSLNALARERLSGGRPL